MPGIITTIGPSTSPPEVLEQLYEQGVRILRFNFTHETPENMAPTLEHIRQVEAKVNGKFQLMMDIEGPSIRTGILSQPRNYKKGELFRIIVGDKQAENNDVRCDYPQIVESVHNGSIVKIESGLFDAVVRQQGPDYIIVEALNDFTMTSKRHINLPGAHVNMPTITEKDKKNIAFAKESGIFEYIAISFCRSAADIQEVKDLFTKQNQIKLIAKIENQEGIDNLDEIIEASDMVMVARGDLGTELPLEKIPEIQMEMVKRCRMKHTPVIVATQMLSSMVKSPAPTRAEVSDVFLAIIEGADYIMLSEETTIGLHPVEAVSMMNKIIAEVQNGR